MCVYAPAELELPAEDDCCHIRYLKQLKIKHIIKILWSCCHTESDVIGNKTNTLMLRQGLLVKQRLRTSSFTPGKTESPPPIGYTAYFLFESFFPFVLSLAAFSQVSVGTDFWGHKGSFYSSHLKNNFLCHLFGFPFFFWRRRQFSSTARIGQLLPFLQPSRPATYKCLKKEPPSARSKTTSKPARVKGRMQ